MNKMRRMWQTLAMTLVLALAATACGPENKVEPETPEKPEIVDPETPDPENPDPENPDPENPELPDDTVYYTEVTGPQEDWTGNYLIAANAADGKLVVLGTWHEKNYALPVEGVDLNVFLTPNGIPSSEADVYRSFVVKTDAGYTVKVPGIGYVGLVGSDNKLYKSPIAEGDSYHWDIRWNEKAPLLSPKSNTAKALKYNGSAPRFACYNGGQTDIRLFRRTVSLEEGSDPEQPTDPDPSDPETPEKLYFNVNESSFNVEAADAAVEFKVFSNVSWTVETDAGLEASPTSGEGNGTVKLTFGANEFSSSRSFKVEVKTSAEVKTKIFVINISQKGKWNPETDEGEWTKVAYADDLQAGKELRLVCSAANVAVGELNENDGYFYDTPALIEGNKVKSPNATCFVLGGQEGSWTLSLNGKTLKAESGNLFAVGEPATTWRIKFDQEGIADINCNIGSFIYNSGARPARFKPYNSASGNQMHRVEIYMKDYDPNAGGRRPTVDFGDLIVSDITASGAGLTQVYSNATAVPEKVGFHFARTREAFENNTFDYAEASKVTATDGAFYYYLKGLVPDTEYFVRSWFIVRGTGSYADKDNTLTSPIVSFRTISAGGTGPGEGGDAGGDQPGGNPVLNGTGWLELPATSSQDGRIGTYWDGGSRNYTYNYDLSMYTSLWIAYPLYQSTMSGKNPRPAWRKAPGFKDYEQVNVWDGSYNVEDYSRGHQVANSDRSNSKGMQSQTFYAINSTPQIQNGFNGDIWNRCEQGVRGTVRSSSDTVYVVTGAAFKTVGNDEPVKIIHAIHDKSKDCPVPNYYWKVLLKVKRTSGQVTSASAAAFWFEHKVYPKKEDFEKYACPVDEVEAKTGFDFFANLPDVLEKKVEAQNDWNAFERF